MELLWSICVRYPLLASLSPKDCDFSPSTMDSTTVAVHVEDLYGDLDAHPELKPKGRRVRAPQ